MTEFRLKSFFEEELMDFTWKRPRTREECIHYAPNPEKVLKNAFWLSQDVFVPLDVWYEIFVNLFDDYNPDESEPISFVNKYFDSSIQMKKNPFIVWEDNHLIGLIAEPFSDAWRMKLPTAFDVDVPGMMTYDGECENVTWVKKIKRLAVSTHNTLGYTRSGKSASGIIPRVCDVILGIWLQHPVSHQRRIFQIRNISVQYFDRFGHSSVQNK